MNYRVRLNYRVMLNCRVKNCLVPPLFDQNCTAVETETRCYQTLKQVRVMITIGLDQFNLQIYFILFLNIMQTIKHIKTHKYHVTNVTNVTNVYIYRLNHTFHRHHLIHLCHIISDPLIANAQILNVLQ